MSLIIGGQDAVGVRHAAETQPGPLNTVQPLLVGTSSADDATKDNSNNAPAVSRVVSLVPTRPLLFVVRSFAAVTRYLMAFNAAAVPGNLTPPDVMLPVEVVAGDQLSISVPAELLTIGLVWAVSTTDLTLTLSGAADFWVTTYHRP